MKKERICLVFLFFAVMNLSAQNPFVRQFTTQEGLPSNCVYKVFQDSKKFIWFATDAGVARYDGSRYTYFRKQEGLSSNDVFDIKEDCSGRIWFFHINASLDFFYNNIIHNPVNTPYLDSLRTDDFFHKFYEDKQHTIYFYQNSKRQIFTLDSLNRVTKYQLPKVLVQDDVTPNKIEQNDIRSLCKNDSGEYIMGTPAGYLRTSDLAISPVLFDNSFRFFDVLTSSSNENYSVARPKDVGVYDLRKIDWLGQPLTGLEPVAKNISYRYISSVLEDRSGIVWISMFDKGLFCYKGNQLLYHFNIKDSKIITEDHENNIWVSSLKEGVFRINPFINQHQHYEKTLFEKNGVYAIANNDTLGIWCTNGKKIYLLKDDKFYSSDFQDSEHSLNEILQVGPDKLLVGEPSKRPFSLVGFHLNHAAQTIHFKQIGQSEEIFKRIAFNRPKNEISSFNQFRLYFIDPAKLFNKIDYKVLDERINYIYYNSDNQLIVSAKKKYAHTKEGFEVSAELSRFNNKIIVDHLNLAEGAELFNIDGDSLFVMKDKNLYNLSAAFDQQVDFQIKCLAYHDSTLFIATSKNIYVCNNPLGVLKNETVSLHMVNLSFRIIHAMVFNGEKLYVGSDDGLTSITFRKFQDLNTLSPVPYFLSIRINEVDNFANQPTISMATNQRVHINFSSINYSITPVIYSYMLEGSDADWTVSRGNNVILQNLPKGKYIFKLRGKKPNSAWSEPIQFTMVVKATIWQQPLFYILIILFLAGILFLIIIRRKNIQLNRREVENQIILLEQKSLQAMMNPHFIFNSLGSIQNFLLHNKPYEAGIYLSQFARLIRQNLNAIDTSMINLEEEINRMKNYFDLEKLRLGDKFSYSIQVNDAIESEEVLIPSMIIQPFAENAIWHGIANLEGKGIIDISFKFHTKNSLLIVIEDSGIGFKNSEKYSAKRDSHLNLGMNIVRKRLVLLGRKYGIETGVTAVDKTPGSPNPGSRVTIVVPFIYGTSESSV